MEKRLPILWFAQVMEIAHLWDAPALQATLEQIANFSIALAFHLRRPQYAPGEDGALQAAFALVLTDILVPCASKRAVLRTKRTAARASMEDAQMQIYACAILDSQAKLAMSPLALESEVIARLCAQDSVHVMRQIYANVKQADLAESVSSFPALVQALRKILFAVGMVCAQALIPVAALLVFLDHCVQLPHATDLQPPVQVYAPMEWEIAPPTIRVNVDLPIKLATAVNASQDLLALTARNLFVPWACAITTVYATK